MAQPCPTDELYLGWRGELASAIEVEDTAVPVQRGNVVRCASRNDVISGPAPATMVLVDDPDGNLIELRDPR